jgi:hypothetical protein
MIAPRLKSTLIYCLVVFCLLTPIYYVVYGFIGKDFAPGERLQTSLIYSFIVMLFLGALRYFFRNKPEDGGGDAGAN